MLLGAYNEHCIKDRQCDISTQTWGLWVPGFKF